MSNRHSILNRSKVSYKVDPLVALLDSCRRNGRPAKFPPKTEKIYFDVDRFRWWFANRDGKNLQQWRDHIDALMRQESP